MPGTLAIRTEVDGLSYTERRTRPKADQHLREHRAVFIGVIVNGDRLAELPGARRLVLDQPLLAQPVKARLASEPLLAGDKLKGSAAFTGFMVVPTALFEID